MIKSTMFILIAIFITSCYYDNKEELYPVDPSKLCDTTTVTYSGEVSVIMVSSCSTVGCHIGSLPAAGIALDNYIAVKANADNGKLMGTIKHDPGFSIMPKGAAKLTDCDISKLDAWINSGALNN